MNVDFAELEKRIMAHVAKAAGSDWIDPTEVSGDMYTHTGRTEPKQTPDDIVCEYEILE